MSLLVLLAAAVASAPADPDPAWRCTAKHYGTFVSPSGASAKWPVLKALPEHLRNKRSMLLNTSGAYAGGKSHVMYADTKSGTAYIEQSAGTLAKAAMGGT